MSPTIWQYSNNGAISSDGEAQLSGVDRTRYLVRFGARLVLVNCENFTVGDVSRAAIYLSQPMNWMTEAGPQPVGDEDRARLKAFLGAALPVIGREPEFQ
jgi:hypothetical protein